MEITIIGTGTAVPSLTRSSPCLLIRSRGISIVCDTGPGALRELLKVGVCISDIDVLCYSHFHIDHTADFTPLLFAANYNPDNPRDRDLFVVGPPGFRIFYDRLCSVYGHWIKPERFKVLFHEVDDDKFTFSAITFRAAHVLHTESSIAIRIEDDTGRSVVYSGDTGFCPNLIELASGTDLLILECSFPDSDPRPGHLTPSLAGKIAREAGCHRLILTHLYPACDRVDIIAPLQREFSGEVILAHDLLSVHV